MNPLDWLARRPTQALSAAQQQRCAQLPQPQALDATPLGAARLVVVDLETSGLNVHRDRILSVGAVVISDYCIDLGSQYECTLYREDHKVTESILIHGIAPSEIAQGVDAVDALLDFMDFAGECVFVAFHAAFDQRMLLRGLRLDLGYKLRHKFIDAAELAPMLFPEANLPQGSLDDWQGYFQLRNSQRHNAAADALATAEIMLILMARARSQGLLTLAELKSRLSQWRRLRHARVGSF
ncbi:3'-5' exonuclease [Halopseudomonas sabulinigri]|uniref:3'-5' exonuclease n=1 Tax=Halopseudomonas sabulinigri TaxID=472181 RepID=A0ABP9ZKQ2_9GAMM